MSTVRKGDILAGKYLIEQVLGQGGMGVVVAARHAQLGHHVAIKYLTAEACQQHDAVERFLREARAAVQIRSEHVARVVDVGTLETGAPYMVMEFLSGSDLSQVLYDRGAPFGVEEAVEYVVQACEAIAEAHSLGIVHRDLKPANLFLTCRADGSPLVKVLDFGISKAIRVDVASPSNPNLTKTDSIIGSPTYMSPEQLRSSKNVDPRTDIWSLGVILYELLTGQPVFEADSVSGLLAQIVADPPRPPRALRPDLPVALEHAILRCLEKDPARRTANVAELARALLPFAPRLQGSVERISRVVHAGAAPSLLPASPASGSSSADVLAGRTGGGWGTTDIGRNLGRRGRIGAVISVGLVVGFAAVYAAYQGRLIGVDGEPPRGATVVLQSDLPAPTTAAPAALPAAPSASSVAPAASSAPLKTVDRPPAGGKSPGAKSTRAAGKPAHVANTERAAKKDLFNDTR